MPPPGARHNRSRARRQRPQGKAAETKDLATHSLRPFSGAVRSRARARAEDRMLVWLGLPMAAGTFPVVESRVIPGGLGERAVRERTGPAERAAGRGGGEAGRVGLRRRGEGR